MVKRSTLIPDLDWILIKIFLSLKVSFLSPSHISLSTVFLSLSLSLVFSSLESFLWHEWTCQTDWVTVIEWQFINLFSFPPTSSHRFLLSSFLSISFFFSSPYISYRYGGSEAATFCCLTTLYKQLNFEDCVDVYMYSKLYHLRRPGVWRSQVRRNKYLHIINNKNIFISRKSSEIFLPKFFGNSEIFQKFRNIFGN